MQLDLWWDDLRYAWRNAVRRPAFTVLVVLTLALGIGASSAVLVLLDSILVQPLPYRDPGRLVFVWQSLPEHHVAELEPTPFDYTAWQALNGFSAVALIATDAHTLAGDDNPERVRGARVTASLMPLLGIAPQAGRAFEADEDHDAARATVILSDGLWRRRFGGDRSILGSSVTIDGEPRVVVGIMPPDAHLPGPLAGSDELFLPARMTQAEAQNAVSHNYSVVARLRSGATVASASAEAVLLADRLAIDRPESHRGLGVRLVPFDEQTSRTVKPVLLVVAGGVALLLLVACANVSSLLMARAAARQHDAAVRSALGATLRQLRSMAIAESIVFATLGGAAGLLAALWTAHAIVPLLAETLPAGVAVEMSTRVVLVTMSLSLCLGVSLGFVVSAHVDRRAGNVLRNSARTASGAPSIVRARSVLVATQVALSVVLLATSGLLLRSVAKLSRINPGFVAEHVLTFKVSLAGSGYSERARRVSLVTDLVERLNSVPGITRSALTSTIPFGGTRGANGVEIEGHPAPLGESIIIDQRQVTAGYFATMGIPLLEGRGFLETDDSRAERVIVVNRRMAERYWPNGDVVGARVRLTAGGDVRDWMRIVGVVEDVRHISLSRDSVPEMYSTYSQAPVETFTVVARTTGDPTAALPAVRTVLRALDPGLPLYDVRTMSDRISRSFAQTRATMLLLLVTAALAAALAGVGIYGAIWYSVSQRTQEIGIRLALGASRASIWWSVVSRALTLTIAGAVVGIGLTMLARPLLSGFLFETPMGDGTTLTWVVEALAALTFAASAVPALRAMRTDPMTALRNE
ncbi:MAG TPA: ABC transporter permease [Vicinamibacterales bacterium]